MYSERCSYMMSATKQLNDFLCRQVALSQYPCSYKCFSIRAGQGLKERPKPVLHGPFVANAIRNMDEGPFVAKQTIHGSRSLSRRDHLWQHYLP